MKKFTQLFCFAIAGAPLIIHAQPTITSADFPTISSKWADLGDNRSGMHTVTAGGANLTWDYSTGYFVVDDTSFTSFMLPTAVPNNWGSNFPSSTHAQYSAIDSSAQFFLMNTSGIYFDGIYLGTKNSIGKLDYSPDLLYIPAPSTYNTTKSNTSRIVALTKISTFNAKIINRTVQSIKVDAYGTIKTPAGTYSNTLRYHTFNYSYDSIFVDYIGAGTYTLVSGTGPYDTTDTYMWYSAAQKAPVAIVNFNGPATNSVSEGAQYFNFTLQPSSINELNFSKSFTVYPNPAVNQPVYFSFDANSSISSIVIYNSSGQLVRSEQVGGASQVVLQTNRMETGIYFYSVIDTDRKQLQSGKFMVAK